MTTTHFTTDDRLLTPAEVAALFRVDPKTVTRWAKAGRLTAVRTLGGHRRYHEAEILGLMGASAAPLVAVASVAPDVAAAAG
ncbi:MAG TPA: BldC family transcriptional regulator [Intrasporangium sp.]|uniref:BldC family transcriptional regulator n=1 Tax=Intrasporangium sp. TaxID=1925024 RepID=UPI002D79C8C1|nr:BldC family transcriptional regulator [Intrasporangium sp.]HET7399064.1 BldC family transcriptional regulator [Intrasporangium sp.]